MNGPRTADNARIIKAAGRIVAIVRLAGISKSAARPAKIADPRRETLAHGNQGHERPAQATDIHVKHVMSIGKQSSAVSTEIIEEILTVIVGTMVTATQDETGVMMTDATITAAMMTVDGAKIALATAWGRAEAALTDMATDHAAVMGIFATFMQFFTIMPVLIPMDGGGRTTVVVVPWIDVALSSVLSGDVGGA